MSYLDDVVAVIRAELGEQPDDRSAPELLRLYAVLLLAKGEAVNAADVHNAWVAWMLNSQPTHEDIKPFEDLDESTQQADEPFVAAIQRATRSLRR